MCKISAVLVITVNRDPVLLIWHYFYTTYPS